MLKLIMVSLASSDPVVFGTTSQMVSQLIKCSKEKKREKVLEPYIQQYFPVLMLKFRDISKGLLNTFGALVLLQELVSLENPFFFARIVE